MDANGARILSEQIAQQQHWEEADAVRDGRQPRNDPHRGELESFDGERRVYGLVRAHDQVNGQVAFVDGRMVKVLREGEWVVTFETEERPVGRPQRSAESG